MLVGDPAMMPLHDLQRLDAGCLLIGVVPEFLFNLSLFRFSQHLVDMSW